MENTSIKPGDHVILAPECGLGCGTFLVLDVDPREIINSLHVQGENGQTWWTRKEGARVITMTNDEKLKEVGDALYQLAAGPTPIGNTDSTDKPPFKGGKYEFRLLENLYANPAKRGGPPSDDGPTGTYVYRVTVTCEFIPFDDE